MRHAAVLGRTPGSRHCRACAAQALEGGAGPGVPIVLQFVGLSVPQNMHNQQEQLGKGITAAYYKVLGCCALGVLLGILA